MPWSLRRGSPGEPLRSRVPLGTVDSGVLADVDPAGLVQLKGSDWSLDWWIRAEDRWHHPSMEVAVSQSAEDAGPVLATAVRVPGGEVVSRCAAAQVRAGAWSGVASVVEVTNDSAVPVALVLALRPYRLDARGRISSVELLAADGPRDRVVDDAAPSGAAASREGIVIRVDEADVLLVDRRPVRVAHGTPVDVASALATGSDDKLEGAAEHLVARRWDATPGEDLEVAFVFPLAHTATLTAALSPVDQPVAAATGGGSAFNRAPFNRAPFNRARSAEPTPPLVLPALSSVARGWALHSADDVELTWVVDAAGKVVNWSAGMLRVAGPDAVTAALDPTGSDRARSAAMELESICRALSSLPAGELHLAVASALVRAQRFSGRVEPRRGQDATLALVWVAGPLLWCDQALRHAEEMAGPVAKALRWLERNGADGGAPVEGPRRSSAAAEALRRVAVGLSVVGQPDLAEQAIALAAGMHEVATVAAGGTASGDAELDGARDSADHTGQALTRSLLADLATVMPGARRHWRDGEAGAFDAGTGFDVVELAALRNRLLASVVADAPEGPSLFGLWSAEWAGRPLEVHRMPTAWGRVSAAVRWHGRSPALLWDLQPWLGTTEGTAPVVSAPGLRPGWKATGWSGEVLLEPAPGGGRV